MEADDEERLAAKAQREMRFIGRVADARIGLLAQPFVLVGQRLDARPQIGFEPGFVEPGIFFEQDDQRLKQHRILPV
jgi:hypothetical protein